MAQFAWPLKEAVIFGEPFLIKKIIDYFSDEISLKEVLIYATVLVILVFYTNIAHHVRFSKLMNLGSNCRIACLGLIYKKVRYSLSEDIFLTSLTWLVRVKLLRSKSLANKNLAGQTLTLISNDAANTEKFFTFLPVPVTSFLKLAGSIYVLIHYVNFTILSGLVLVFLSLATTFLLGKLNKNFK